MKAFELRESGTQDLETRLEEVKEEFFNLRFQNATGQLENYKQLGRLKRDIARLETVLKERELELDTPGEASAEQAVEKSARRASRKWGRKAKGSDSDESSENEEPGGNG